MKALAEIQTPAKVPTLRTVPQFVDRHPFVSNGGLRFQIFDAKNNGLEEAGAIVRIGRKVLIDEEKYFAWIDNQQKVFDGGK